MNLTDYWSIKKKMELNLDQAAVGEKGINIQACISGVRIKNLQQEKIHCQKKNLIS